MHSKNNTLALHATIALEIKAAKKSLFARHRAGTTLAEALRIFRIDIGQRFEKITPALLTEEEEGIMQRMEAAPVPSLPCAPGECDHCEQRDTDPAWVKLANAIAEIASSDAAPQALQDYVIDFLSSNSADIWQKLMIEPPMIVDILVAAKSKEESE